MRPHIDHAQVNDLIEEHGMWGEHPDYPSERWRLLVSNDVMRLGYWDWVAFRLSVDNLSARQREDVPLSHVDPAELKGFPVYDPEAGKIKHKKLED